MAARSRRTGPGAWRRVVGRIESAETRLTGRSVLSVLWRTPVLVLHTTGRRSGRPRATTLAWHRLDDGTIVVVGGAGGQERLPDWVANVRADPRAAMTVDRVRTPVRVEEVVGAERDATWQTLRAVWPRIDGYQRRSGRAVPIFRLHVAGGPAVPGRPHGGRTAVTAGRAPPVGAGFTPGVRLIHLNGMPGIGKSSVARRYVDERPLALLLDIDGIRTALGGWREHEESKLVARDLAVALAEAHLRAGHDVVVPQYLGRIDFIHALDELAVRCEARFVEVLLDAPGAETAIRFRARRAELLARGEHHPQLEVPDDGIEAAVEDARAALERVVGERPRALRVQAGGSADETYAAVLAALG